MMGRTVEAEAASRESLHLSSVEMHGPSRYALLRFTNARHLLDLGRYGSALNVLLEVHAQLAGSTVAFWPEAVELMLAQAWLRIGQVARALPLLLRDDEAAPDRLRATRRQMRVELVRLFPAAAPGLPPAHEIAAEARLLMRDRESGLNAWVGTLGALSPAIICAESPEIVEFACERERFGLALASLGWHASAAASLGSDEEARRLIGQALALLDDGTWPETMPRNELLWLLFSAARRIGAEDMAARALADGLAWLQQRAVPDIPAEFLDGFLHRHPVNRHLLAAAPRPAEA